MTGKIRYSSLNREMRSANNEGALVIISDIPGSGARRAPNMALLRIIHRNIGRKTLAAIVGGEVGGIE